MNVLKHLKKINKVHGWGRAGYWYLACSFGLNYLFNRPSLAKLTYRNRYQQEKKLFYTVTTGDYDQLNEIPVILPNWDFVCFTDNPELKSNSWQIRVFENDHDLDPIRLSRHLKINNHLIDNDYDLSIYVDGNIKIRGDLDSFLAQALPLDKQFAVLLHPFHTSLLEEVELCVTTGKDHENVLWEQYHYYVDNEQFCDPFPHINARMLIRRTNDGDIRQLMEFWFAQLMQWSRRDQVGFNYSLSKCPNLAPHYIPYWIFRSYFKKMDHH